MTNTRTRSGRLERPEIDVVILGSGIAGTALAAVLARGGAKVQILDAGQHPRFAIGESTIPYTSMLMRLVGERYDVQEFKQLTTFHNAQANITRNGGIKKNFGFLYHREGRPQIPEESHEFPIPKVTHTENHFFRQDLDAWLLNVALGHGAKVRQQAKITEVDFDDAGVTVFSDTGETWRARYVVDASGFRSPVAARHNLRETPSRLRHHSRSIFTHMTGVTPYEETVPDGTFNSYHKWSEGTLHHVFDGGWLWVIPFNNHPRATNPLVSVGLQVDPRIHPAAEGLTPEQEFRQFADRFPNIRKQFATARPVREWISTGRLQYSPTQTVGHRYCLTSHAAGFIDPLFSRGMSNTFEIINGLAWRLLDALREDDFSVERFEPVQELEQGQLDFNDNLVANAYTSFSSFELWDSWCRVWALGQFLATMEINRAYAKLLNTGDHSVLGPLEKIAPYGALPDYPPLRTLYTQVSDTVQDVAEGRRQHLDAANTIMNLLTSADFVPPVGLGDPDCRYFGISLTGARKSMKWAKNDAPEFVGTLMHEGLTMFIKHRLDRSEYNLAEEFRHALSSRKRLGARLRIPTAR
ncbi:MAG: NAD(P)/FAD-dependent oxidoreductase [Streptosporangiaceae bacterium]